MGAGASTAIAPDSEQTALIKLEASKPLDSSDVDTPRGVTAKEEVIRLRALLRKTALPEVCESTETKSKVETPAPTEETVADSKPEEEGEESSDEDEGPDLRKQCKICNRKFNPDRIEKHESVCSKVKAKPTLKKTETEEVAAAKKPEETSTNLSEKPKDDKAKWREDRKKLKELVKKDRELPTKVPEKQAETEMDSEQRVETK